MKLKNLLAGIALSAVMGVGVFAGVSLSTESREAKAATATTVYYAVPSSVVGSYTVKLNINRQGDADNWATYVMSRDGTKTQGGKLLYKATYTDLYDGVGAMQFQLYEGSTWKGQQQPISSWTSVSVYNGKVYVHDTGWADYNPDTTMYTVTKYKKLDSATPVSIGSEQVAAGTSYARPANRFEDGYSFDGWFSNAACTTPYNGSTINANLNLYAKYTSHTWSGTVHVDLRETFWSEAGCNYAVMFMNKTTYPEEHDAWSSYVTGTVAGQLLVDIPYNIGFEPLQMTIVRYDPDYSQASWNSNKWASVWGQTKDTTFSTAARIGTIQEAGKNEVYCGYPQVIGGTSGAWANITYLDSVKLNGSKHAEWYSTTVTLAANTEFKIQVAPFESGDYYNAYSTHDSIKDNFGYASGENPNIKAKVAGTYAFYYDSRSFSVYITTVAIAEADDWSQTFLSGVTCSGSGSITKDGWTTLSGTYSSLSSDAKTIFTSMVAGKEDGTYTEQAVYRYDYIVKKYGTTAKPDFMGRIAAGKLSLSVTVSPLNIGGSNNNTVLIAIVISSVAVTVIGGYFYIRRRKENN